MLNAFMGSWNGRTRVALAALVMAAGSDALAQQPDSAPPAGAGTFEVASIKRNTSGLPGPTWDAPPGRWGMTNGPIASLIWSAYDPPVYELPGAPPWVFSERYDVIATYTGRPGREETAAMLRLLLAERFKLAVHVETQPRPVYALVVARPGRLGPGLVASTTDCAGPGARCGMSLGSGTLRVTGGPVSHIASVGRPDDRIIVDRTGLTGNYDFTLRYTMQPGPTDDIPSLFTALEEQLGLKLVPANAPMQILVVDRIERPTPD